MLKSKLLLLMTHSSLLCEYGKNLKAGVKNRPSVFFWGRDCDYRGGRRTEYVGDQNQNQNHISDSDSHIRIGDSDSDQQLYLSSLVPLIFLTQIPCLRKYDYSIVTCQHCELWFQFQISNQIYVNFAPRLKIQKLADVFLQEGEKNMD